MIHSLRKKIGKLLDTLTKKKDKEETLINRIRNERNVTSITCTKKRL